MLGQAATLPTIGFNLGGTHMIAHAAHQLLNQMGCKFHLNEHIDSIPAIKELIQNLIREAEAIRRRWSIL